MRRIYSVSLMLIVGCALTACGGQPKEATTLAKVEEVVEQTPTVQAVVEEKAEVNTESKEEETVIPEKQTFEVPADYDKPHIEVQYGKLVDISYHSNTTKTERKAHVLLPAGYTTDKKYPVLYLLHGIGGDENEWLYGKPEQVIGNLISAQEAEEMIVVFPNVRARADDSANPADIFTLEHFKAFDNFINDLSNDLMPYIAENYAIKTGRENTAIAGLSMGGRESLYIGFSMPETFGYIGAFCPAFGILGYSNNNVTEEGLFTQESFVLPKDLETMVMIVKGKEDGVVRDEPVKYHNALVTNDVPHIYYETTGGHDFTVWNHGLYQFTKRIFKDASCWESDIYTVQE